MDTTIGRLGQVETGRGGVDMLGPVAPTMPVQDVRIVKAENGFIVIIGCKQFVSQQFSEVALGIELYFKDPKAAQEKFCNKV